LAAHNLTCGCTWRGYRRGCEVVVAVTNGQLDGQRRRASAELSRGPHAEGLAEVFGTWKRIFQGQAEWLAQESRRSATEAGVGQDYRRVGEQDTAYQVPTKGS
jgi:hypothetical protein